MRTTLEKPSTVTSSTVPVPSTWPCTKWPPRRSSGRSGNSRFTGSPSPSGPSEERRRVSAITSARKAPSATVTAVRQTPLTAIESPSLSSSASEVSTSRRDPAGSFSTARTLPRSRTSPVNTSPLRHPGADEHVVMHALDLAGERANRGVDRLHALAFERHSRMAAAHEDRRDKQAHLIDLARVEERTRQVRPTLEQQRLDPPCAELRKRRAHARPLVLPWSDEHLHAGGLQGVGGRARGAPGAHEVQRHLARRAHELARRRQARLGIEHHSRRLAVHALDARREQRVVRQRGPDTHRHN